MDSIYRLSEVYRFVELCLFDAWIGNNDRHGRNLAFVTKAGGIRALSPLFDNPSYIGIADENLLEADHHPRGTITTAMTNEPVMSDYVIEFRRLGYEEVINKFKDKIISKSSKVFSLVSSLTILSNQRSKAFITLLEKRLGDLENA